MIMSDWEIIRIKDDPAAIDTPRWTIVYSVPVEYSPDGVFSHSTPKSILNVYAAAFEYDVQDEEQLDALFAHVLTRPMLTASTSAGASKVGGLGAALARGDAVGETLAKAREVCTGRQTYTRDPAELRTEVAAGIAEMKTGLAQLRPAGQVELHAAGQFVEMADMSENPKYLVMRDMVARLRPENIANGRGYFRERRKQRMAEGKG